MPNSPMTNLAMKKATKLKNAAHRTAVKGVSHFGRDDRGDGVRGVVKPVDVVENQCQNNDDDQQFHASGVFDHDGLQGVGNPVGLVGGVFQKLDDLDLFEQLDGILLLAEDSVT